MRILMVADQFRPPASGAAVFTDGLSKGLARSGHEVVVLTPAVGPVPVGETSTAAAADATGGGSPDPVGLAVVRSRAFALPGKRSHVHVDLPSGGMAERLLETFRPDVVHVQDYLLLCRTVARAANRRRLPLVATNHFLPENLIPYLPVLRLAPGSLAWLLWKPVMAVLERAHVVTTATATGARILEDQGLSRPVEAISCGIDLARFGEVSGEEPGGTGGHESAAEADAAEERRRVRRAFALPPEPPLFLFVGRVDREKRLDLLLRAAALLPDVEFHVAIAGKGEHRERLSSLARDYGLEHRVTFVGYVPDANLPVLLRAADVFVMPSAAELQSIATLEAMASGRPVVAADARALPELVEPGKNGYLFTSGSASDLARVLRRMVERREAWPRMGAASRRLAEKHDRARTVERYEELYARVAETRRPASSRSA